MTDETNAPPPARAAALWQALRDAGRAGLTASGAAEAGIASAPYARRIMRAWAAADYVVHYDPLTSHRDDSGHFVMRPSAPAVPPVVSADGHVQERPDASTPAAMAPGELARRRRQAGLSLHGLGAAIGWTGHPNSVSRSMRRFESGERRIDEVLAEKIRAAT